MSWSQIKVFKILFFSLLFTTLNLQAQKCEMVIFGNNTKAPKSYIEDGQNKGILVEMVDYIGKDMNCQFTVKLNPWKRAYNYALNDKGGIFGFSKNTERVKLFDYSDVMFYDDMLLVTLKDNKFKYSSIQDLKGKKVGVVRGGSFGEEFHKALKGNLFEIVEDSNPQHRLAKLLRGVIDVALIGPGKAGVYDAINNNPKLIKNKEKFIILSTPFNRDPNYLGISKRMNKKDFLVRFNKSLQKGKESGAFDKIVQKYSKH
jgi:polar amino acid transport system substrate-binding protein